MRGTLRIDPNKGQIIMSREFAKFCYNTTTEEFAHLQYVRQQYPTYSVVKRTIKRNSTKESYAGLNYTYMEDYISTHDNAEKNMAIYQEMRLIAQCHSKARRYAPIKNWFLDTYPEIKEFGMPKEPTETAATQSVVVEEIVSPAVSSVTQFPVPATEDIKKAS